MKTYAITGGASGIGLGLKNQLIQGKNAVIDVDLRDADILADLSTDEGRQTAIAGIRSAMPEGLDGFIPCAGLGAHVNNPKKIIQVNYFGVTAIIEGIRDLLASEKDLPYQIKKPLYGKRAAVPVSVRRQGPCLGRNSQSNNAVFYILQCKVGTVLGCFDFPEGGSFQCSHQSI